MDPFHSNTSSSDIDVDADEIIAENAAICRKGKKKLAILAMQACVKEYCFTYIDKKPCRTSALSGWAWVEELLMGHPDRIHQNLRMSREVFLQLCKDLVNLYDFRLPRYSHSITVEESVAMFLLTIGQGVGVRQIQERFQHSGETVHRHIHYVLNSLKLLPVDYCKTIYDQSYIHPYLKKKKYKIFAKDCIGALDGTHVRISPPSNNPLPYYGRKGYTQNILAVCDFDWCFTFVSAGWEDSMHDSRVFQNIINDPNKKFPYPQGDKYYLVDAGYPNCQGYLAPYKGERYHLNAFRQGDAPRNDKENFNYVHSSLRSTIERSFGVWKNRWAILNNMPAYDITDQTAIVGCSMALHNYIRRHNTYDEEIFNIENIEDYQLDENEDDVVNNVSLYDDDNLMNQRRNNLRERLINNSRRRS